LDVINSVSQAWSSMNPIMQNTVAKQKGDEDGGEDKSK
jgi:hypothetical protein